MAIMAGMKGMRFGDWDGSVQMHSCLSCVFLFFFDLGRMDMILATK